MEGKERGEIGRRGERRGGERKGREVSPALLISPGCRDARHNNYVLK